jgi:hypothetical protein
MNILKEVPLASGRRRVTVELNKGDHADQLSHHFLCVFVRRRPALRRRLTVRESGI